MSYCDIRPWDTPDYEQGHVTYIWDNPIKVQCINGINTEVIERWTKLKTVNCTTSTLKMLREDGDCSTLIYEFKTLVHGLLVEIALEHVEICDN
jgi:hypothetical protein